MEPERFDALAERLATSLPRRGALRALVGAAAGAVLARFAADEAEAKKKGKKGGGKGKGGDKGCAAIGQACTTPGQPGKVMPCCGNATCLNGRCSCGPNRKNCKGRCIAKDACCSDKDCGGGATCKGNGACACPKAKKACRGTCIAKNQCCTDKDCGGGAECQANGKCACPAGKERCGGTCADTNSDAEHCGKCGNACGKDESCRDGQCVVVVSPKNMHGWEEIADQSKGDPPRENGVVEFVQGPGTPPLGKGSVRFYTAENSKRAEIIHAGYAGMKIAGITELKYSTYMENGAGTTVVVPAIKLHLDELPDSDKPANLVYEPTYGPAPNPVQGQWDNDWDALGDDARWWSTKDIPDGEGGFHMCNPNGPNRGKPECNGKLYVPWSTVRAALTDAKLRGLVIGTGGGTGGADGNVDKVIVNGVTYDFEP